MLRIVIREEVRDTTDMVTLLERIGELLDAGYTSGISPSWRLEGEEEPYTEDELDERDGFDT